MIKFLKYLLRVNYIFAHLYQWNGVNEQTDAKNPFQTIFYFPHLIYSNQSDSIGKIQQILFYVWWMCAPMICYLNVSSSATIFWFITENNSFFVFPFKQFSGFSIDFLLSFHAVDYIKWENHLLVWFRPKFLVQKHVHPLYLSSVFGLFDPRDSFSFIVLFFTAFISSHFFMIYEWIYLFLSSRFLSRLFRFCFKFFGFPFLVDRRSN